MLTPEFRIADVSEVYLAGTFTTHAQLLGQYIFDAFSGPPNTPEGATMAALRASLAQVVATGLPHQMPVQNHHHPNPAAPGQVREHYWQLLNTPILAPQSTISGIIHWAMDMTEREQAATYKVFAQRQE